MSTQESFTQEILETDAQTLLTLSEDELNQLLGMRVHAIQMDMNHSLQPSFEVTRSPLEASLPRWIQRTVDAMIKTALVQSHNVLCSNDPDYAGIRNQLLTTLGLGGTAAVIAFAGFLTSTLGIAVALATVLATIVIKKIGEPTLIAGHQTMCIELKNLLQARYSE